MAYPTFRRLLLVF